jgi:hypothetical protein
MITFNKEAPERQEIEALLPWHAAGTLSRRDADRVEQALLGDRELSRRFELVREELTETIHLNETLGAPSSRAMEKLFAAIDKEAPAPKKMSFNVIGRLVELISSFSPRTLAWTAAAAALALMVQGAVLTTVAVRDQSGAGTTQLAGANNGLREAFVRFVPQANLADVTRFLNTHNAVLVNGPKQGGYYHIRLKAREMTQEEFDRIIARMKAETRIVETIAPRK